MYIRVGFVMTTQGRLYNNCVYTCGVCLIFLDIMRNDWFHRLTVSYIGASCSVSLCFPGAHSGPAELPGAGHQDADDLQGSQVGEPGRVHPRVSPQGH